MTSNEMTVLRIPDTIEPDPVIEYYKQFVDRRLLRELLQLSPTERLQRCEALQELAERYPEYRNDVERGRILDPRVILNQKERAGND